MKINLLFCLLFALAFSISTFAQSVVITPKKVVYTRKGNDIPPERKKFDITYPIISGRISAAAKSNLKNTLSYERVFETPMQENLESSWLSEAYYKVNYNKNGLLDISLTQEGIGAYPDEQMVNQVIDLKTGKQVTFAEVFNLSPEFAELVNTKLDAEKKAMIARINKGEFSEDGKEAAESLKDSLAELSFTAESFNEYKISDKGVTILYDAGFAHAFRATQPVGRYFFTWTKIKPFVKPRGLLARFIR